MQPGESRERQIAAGEVQAWRVTVEPGANLLVMVDQHSIDLVVEARGSGDRNTITADGGNDRWGPEVLLLETAGEVRIEIRPREKSAWPGSYILRTEALPAAGDPRRDAFALMSRAGREALPATPEARRQALATYREARVAWRSLGERAWEAETLICLAFLEKESSELQLATLDFLAAMELWRDLKELNRQAEALNELGVIYLDTQGTDKTREALESSLSLWQALRERFAEAETRTNLCFLEHRRGALPTALACYQEVLAFYREHGIRQQEALILNNIGGVYDLQGEPDAAFTFYEQALAMRHALGDRTGEVGTLNNIAVVHRTLGEWQEALRIYDRAREVLSSLGNHSLEAAVLNNIGFTYNNLGDPDRALGYLENALRLRREVGDRSGEITTLNNLGLAWRGLGDVEKALNFHRKALALATRLGNPQQAISRQRLSEVYLDQGKAGAALRELDALLPVLREKGAHRAELEVLQLRGRALVLAGRAREALPVLQEVQARRRALRDRAGEAETLHTLAATERSLGLVVEARSHAEAAMAQVEELRTTFVSSDLRASFLGTRRRTFSLLIDLLMDQHAATPGLGYDRAAFAISERARARSLLDVLSVEGSGHTTDAVSPELLVQRRSLLRRLSAKVDQRWKQSGERAAALEHASDEILAQIDALDAEIYRHDPTLAPLSTPRPISPEEIYGGLDPGTMLLEYSLGEDRSFLWAIGDGQFRSFVLPSQKKIEALARRVYSGWSTVEAGNARRGEAAEELARILLGPIWRDAARLSRLVVVPDGALGILPFAALPVPDFGRSSKASGALKPLLEYLEVVYIPSATALAVQRQRLQRRASAPKWAAILADPVFSANDPRLAHRSAANLSTRGKRSETEALLRGGGEGDLFGSFERLPSTRREAEAVAGLAPAGQVWLGLDLAASRQVALSGKLRDYRILHFATHAVADTRNPELSGLVLSQVDAGGQPQEGFLGLSDIYELDLDADLVVLSGCRTALGKEVRGEGLMGLTRAFQYAGAPRVVASLWRVQDRTTAELMTRFYRAMWRDHLPPAAALSEAQRSLRADPRYRDPYSWAAFVLQGDWR